ncbi:hypothetical protein SAMN04487995_1761 [Dyadobacter koreensis]|uniref:DUF2000 domain-containing protein n=1 Tax=Dyadobacter koreensis TaxID=408657 RepID=A0A1H6SSC6_9BACT|nr:DUF2000 domain-containing protein [Dyadobacter koreensis]SEI69786.1 hypothetical protein SAMN04487995_1761 [Dyadobacter koreensis]
MDFNNLKCVLIIDKHIDTGSKTNVASILSISIGDKIKGLVGPDLIDSSGIVHSGLTRLPIPVLGATTEEIIRIRQNFIQQREENDLWVDFSTSAQQARTYEEYMASMQRADPDKIIYLGIALFSFRKKINRATKGLSLIS